MADDLEDAVAQDVPPDDDSDLRRRTFLERHDWIPWVGAAILVGGVLGLLKGD